MRSPASSRVLSGISLVGLTTSADANIALRYTLLSIAGVILGGGEFIGGRVSPIGAVIGALTLTLAGSFLSFLRISPGLADRRAGRDPDHRAGAARCCSTASRSGRSAHDRVCACPQALDLVLRRRASSSGSPTILFTGGASALAA